MESTENMEEQTVKKSPKRGSILIRLVVGIVLYVIVPAAIIGCSVFVAKRLMDSGPEAHKRTPQRNAKLVEVETVKPTSHQVIVEAYGQVRPSRTIRLQPRVSGQIIDLSHEFTEGGVLKTGDTVLKLDPKDFELSIRQRIADVAKVQSALKVEQGQQTIASQEYALMKETVTEEDRDWVLRKPQLESAQAALESAQAILGQAKLDLERTKVTAPFNAVVKSKDVELGAQVGPSTSLGTMVGTDEYWVVATVPVNELKWLDIPHTSDEKGSLARVYDDAAWDEGAFREGRIVRLLSELETQGRMAQILVAVNDPLSLQKKNRDAPRLLSGSYVRVEIEGHELGEIFDLARNLVYEQDKVWIKSPEGKLEIRTVKIAYRGKERIYISEGLAENDLILTTKLSSPVAGMALRTADEAPTNPDAGGSGKPDKGTPPDNPDKKINKSMVKNKDKDEGNDKSPEPPVEKSKGE